MDPIIQLQPRTRTLPREQRTDGGAGSGSECGSAAVGVVAFSAGVREHLCSVIVIALVHA